MKIKQLLLAVAPFKYVIKGFDYLKDPYYVDVQKLNRKETSKSPVRTEIINYLLSGKGDKTCYLEIGVRNPEKNFNHIKASEKYSVDPGVEFKENPVDFKMTSDAFFEKLSANEILNNNIKFDVIFIDGLHLADQVDRDIINALQYIKDDGFIVLHDCNPPTEFHARERYGYYFTPANGFWNGTTWKAFLKWRFNPTVYSCCVDTDWGVGILSKTVNIGESITPVNPFFEFTEFDQNRKAYMNLISFDKLKEIVG
ncbi:class I SAM-dependent methyltransferase [Flavobacterium sp. RHBU_3]|uniref:class I SAM-dependent methyltransferase n=1 Tax=Flavobacterium sp. RHBU_3 TaxID=3391184 RepID=UPI003984BEB5